MLLITVILMDLLSGMEFDLFVPSFPELQAFYHLSPAWVEALLSVNFIGFCISIFFVGGLADRYGRKPIILLGLITFIIGSLLCIIYGGFSLLLIGRFLQGIGIAAPAILSFLIIADAYPLEKQQFYMAMLNGAMNASVAAAPVVGSYLTLYFHWHGNFTALLLLGVVVFILTLCIIPAQQLTVTGSKNYLQGYLEIGRSKPLLLLIIYFVAMFIPYWIFVGMTPLLFMESLGVSLKYFGFYQGQLALAFAIGSVIYGFWVNRFDQLKALHFSTLLFAISIVTLAFVSWNSKATAFWITLALMPFVIGQIIPSTILYPVCLNYLPHAKARAAAMMTGGRLIFSSLGLELAGYFYQGTFQNIGIIIMTTILTCVILQFFVLNNREIMKFTETNVNDQH